ncbi:hypothetical protein B6D52_01415 [Candidatus Parcubacteria bacterium 4484_255]|nr:MAG: hypothetical protein B6D52_01415 [Candidatus Parcubacteria bacterium 4484_255]
MLKEDKIEKIIDIILEIFWLTIIFFVPVFFLRQCDNVFEVPKNILFQTLTEFLLFFYVIKIILFPKDKNRWTKIKAFLPFFIFIFILGISVIFSQVRWFSFWGLWERRMGYLAWLHFFVFSLVLFLSIKSKKQIYRILISIIFSSILVVFYGLIQSQGLDIFVWTYDPFKQGRIFSTIGQPNFLGSWLLLVLPVPLIFLYRYRRNFKIKVLAIFLFLLSLHTLFLSKSRGAMVGLVALFIFLFFAWAWKKNKKLIIIPIFCFIFIPFFLFFVQTDVQKPNQSSIYSPFLSRLQSFANLRKIGRYRLMHWRASLDLIKQKPILGHGIVAQRFNFPKYYQPEFAIYEKPNTYLDYAHNDILDVLLSAGLLGLISYLLLVGYVFIRGWRHFLEKSEKTDSQIIVLALMAGLFGYLVSILFSFHVIDTLLYFWLFCVLILFLSAPFPVVLRRPNQSREINLISLKGVLIVFFLFLTIASVYFFNFKLFLSNHFLLKARKAKASGDWSEAISQHERAMYFSPSDPFFRQEFALTLYQMARFPSISSCQKLKYTNMGIQAIKAIPEKRRPIESLMLLPWLTSVKAYLTQKEADFDKAEKLFQKVADFSPQTALIYGKWAELKIARQNNNEAIEMSEKALSLYPDLSHPHLNQEHLQSIAREMIWIYMNLVQIYRREQKLDKALDYCQKSIYLIIKSFPPPYPSFLDYFYGQMISILKEQGEEELSQFWANHLKSLSFANF